MATAHFATGGIGPLWPFIPWADFTGINLSTGQSIQYSCVIPGIGNLNMKLVATSNVWGPTNAAGWPFATTIYTGVTGNPGIISSGSGGFSFQNITLTDTLGNPLTKNYYVIVTDAEGTGTQTGGERLTWVTNGGVWANLGTVPNVTGTQSVITGVGTTTLVSNGSLGTGATFITPIGVTQQPTRIDLPVTAFSRQGTTFGVVIDLVDLEKTVSHTYGRVGDILTYTIAMTNVSLFNTLANPIFVDTLPSNVTYVPNSLKLNGASYTSGTFPSTLTLPDMGPQAIDTITYNVQITSAGPNYVQNSAYGAGMQGTFPNSGVSNTVLTTLAYAILGTTKSVDKTFSLASTTVTYTLVIRNTGNTTATSVVLNDTLPATTTYVAGSVTGATGVPPNFTVANIPANGSVTITYRVLLGTLPANPVTNNSTTTYSYIYNPITSATQTAATISNSVSTYTASAQLNTINKTVNQTYGILNDTLVYTVYFTNTGNATATNVSFLDTIPTNTTFISNSLYINNVNQPGLIPSSPGVSIPDLAPGDTVTVSFSVIASTLPSVNPVQNRGIVNYTYPFNTTPITIASNIVSTTIVMADLNSSKSVNRGYASIGETLVYTIPLRNSGNTNAYDITLIDTLPIGLSLVPNSIYINGVLTGGSLSSPGITVPTIAAGGISTVTFNVLVNSLPSVNPVNNSALINYKYTVNPLSVATSVALSTNIAQTTIVQVDLNGLSKYVDKVYTTPGTTITYTIVIPNNSNVPMYNAVFVDTLSSGLTFINNSLSINGTSTTQTPNNITLGTLPPYSITTITFQGRVI